MTRAVIELGDHPGDRLVRFEPEAEPWPEPAPLPEGLPPVPEFSEDLLPRVLRAWILDISERAQLPRDFPAVGATVGLGSVIGRKVAIRPKHHDDWTEVANLWGAIIGRPGVMKSPALEAALKPLNRLVAEALEAHKRAMDEWLVQSQVAKVTKRASEGEATKRLRKDPDADVAGLLNAGEEPPQPACKRYVVVDTTVEALAEVLRQNPNGVLAFRDELIGLLKQLDKEGNEGARSFFLTAWNGKSGWVSDRILRGLNLSVEACCVSVLGGIQPGVLQGYLREAVRGGAGDDGLLQRFSLLVWPDVPSTWRNVDRWPDTDAKNLAFEAFKRLSALDVKGMGAERDGDGIPYLRFTPKAQEEFDAWRQKFEERVRRGDEHPAFEAHLAKYRKLVPALALIFHLADGGTGPVSHEALLRALAWTEYLEPHARRVYGGVIRSELDAARSLLRRINAGDVSDPFALKDVYDRGWTGLTSRDEARSAIEVLVEYGWLREELDSNTGGRPRTRYYAHPAARRPA